MKLSVLLGFSPSTVSFAGTGPEEADSSGYLKKMIDTSGCAQQGSRFGGSLFDPLNNLISAPRRRWPRRTTDQERITR